MASEALAALFASNTLLAHSVDQRSWRHSQPRGGAIVSPQDSACVRKEIGRLLKFILQLRSVDVVQGENGFVEAGRLVASATKAT